MNTITHVRLRNFKSFGLNHPGVELYPLTTVIGLNGTGKTNLLQGLRLALGGEGGCAGPGTNQLFRHPKHGVDCHHRMEFQVHFSDGGALAWAHRVLGPLSSPVINQSPATRVELLDGLDISEDCSEQLGEIAYRLEEQGRLELTFERYARHGRRPFPFQVVRTQVVGGTRPTDLQIIRLDDHCSDGQLKFLRLFLTLMDRANTFPLLLDLPETSLHLDDQRIIGALICEAAEHRQIIVTTHSPEICAELDIGDNNYIQCELVDGETKFSIG